MNKPELLSPAGNMEALKSAIHNGADAVYIGGKDFGARKFADNFEEDEIIEAIKYAHLYDVKVYVTVNTIIYENEIENAVKYLKFLYWTGVDAVIMQDIGMISLVHQLIPDLEIHASTQTHNCNDSTLQLFKNLGVTRVVMARELSLNQINELKTDIEKEVFIHGALCICYSGCCLFSSLNGGRSGNRGKCAGPCRLPYTLIKNDKPIKTEGQYLLSPKELNTSKQINQILNSNIQSLKIEGRMKSKEHVGYVTKMYRELIDNHFTNNKEKDLKKLFNREFTTGHLFNSKNKDLMNIKSPNHIGIKIGKVINTGKKIKIKLTDDLAQNDGIRFKESNKGLIINKLYNENGLLINSAKKDEIIYLDNKVNLSSLDTVLKTTDYNLIEKLKKYPEKKIPINFEVIAKENQNIEIIISDNKHKISNHGSIVQKSITKPITKENIIKQLSKLGNTPFIINNINVKMDNNIFIPLKELNELRRKLVQKLTLERTKVNRLLPHIKHNNQRKKTTNSININALVTNENQLKFLLDKVNKIYTDDYNLYLKYKNQNVYFKTNRTPTNLQELSNENLLLTELGAVNKYSKNNNCISDYFLNIVNSYSVNFLENKGIKTITLSPELSMNQILEIVKYTNNVEIIIYGTLELMVMNHCIISMNDKCPNCKQDKYYLKNKQNELFPIITKNCKTHIMHHKKIDLLDNLSELKEMGVTNFRLELFDENENQILNILNKVKRIIN